MEKSRDEVLKNALLERNKFCRRFMSAERKVADRRMAEGFLRCFDEMIKLVVEKDEENIVKSDN